MWKYYYRFCLIFLAIVLAIEFTILLIALSFNIMNPGKKGVSVTDFKFWLYFTLPTIALLLLVVLLKKIKRRKDGANGGKHCDRSI